MKKILHNTVKRIYPKDSVLPQKLSTNIIHNVSSTLSGALKYCLTVIHGFIIASKIVQNDLIMNYPDKNITSTELYRFLNALKTESEQIRKILK